MVQGGDPVEGSGASGDGTVGGKHGEDIIDMHWLREAYRRTRKDGAVGVDGQRAVDYEANLEDNLQSLLERAKSGTYKAPPVRRVYIPKGGSTTETRPIGIPAFEDEVWPVRLEAPPGEDPAGSFPSSTAAFGPQASTAGSETGDV